MNFFDVMWFAAMLGLGLFFGTMGNRLFGPIGSVAGFASGVGLVFGLNALLGHLPERRRRPDGTADEQNDRR